MKPIPTEYDGTEYRSRLEARWAVFFDQLEIVHQYEPFTIENNGLQYTPDFVVFNLLYDQLILVEIKPLEPNKKYIEYLQKVRNPEKSDFLILIGEPAFGVPNAIQIFGKHNGVERVSVLPCKKCGFYKFAHSTTYSFCRCQTSFPPNRNHEQAKEYASQYRFDIIF